jgi:hypothetical protein
VVHEASDRSAAAGMLIRQNGVTPGDYFDAATNQTGLLCPDARLVGPE